MRRIVIAALVPMCLSACLPEEDEDTTETTPPVRGLITTLVEEQEQTTIRRYPGILEPGEVNALSFEVGGKMGRLDLSVGQRVTEGQVLARLDSAQFQSTVENRRAALDAVNVRLAQAEEDLQRSESLLERGAVTRVRRDEDRTRVRELQAERTQAEQTLREAEENLKDTVLTAPFDGIVSALDVDSFATLASGQTVLSIYEASDFEVSFFVSFDVASQLVVGTPASVRLADNPDISLAAVVSELGERADTVSSFPVVVALTDISPVMKAGMSVEVSFEFDVPGDGGFLIPTSAAITDGEIPEAAGPNSIQPVPVYVYDPETSTVQRRTVSFAGLRENSFLVVDGLEAGERVAIKGVSFLRDGMEVRLLERKE
ncbi:MAG: efflux RND transporter periplasmic adaptor subunit [Pseudomonadota bacterium]